MDSEVDVIEAQLKQLQRKLRTERARSRLTEVVKDLDYLSHTELVDLYNALVVKLIGSQ